MNRINIGSGQSTLQGDPESVWIKITAVGGADCVGGYSATEVSRHGFPICNDIPEGDSRTWEVGGNPAWEVNKRTDVPIGAIVRAYRSAVPGQMDFAYCCVSSPCPVACPGVGAPPNSFKATFSLVTGPCVTFDGVTIDINLYPLVGWLGILPARGSIFCSATPAVVGNFPFLFSDFLLPDFTPIAYLIWLSACHDPVKYNLTSYCVDNVVGSIATVRSNSGWIDECPTSDSPFLMSFPFEVSGQGLCPEFPPLQSRYRVDMTL